MLRRNIILTAITLLLLHTGCRKTNCLSSGCISSPPEVDDNFIRIQFNTDTTANGYSYQEMQEMLIIFGEKDTLEPLYITNYMEFGFHTYTTHKNVRTVVIKDPVTQKETVIDNVFYITTKDDCCTTHYKMIGYYLNGQPFSPDDIVMISK